MVVLTIPTYAVTRPYRGFRHPDWMAPVQTVREGNILSLAFAGILHSSMLSFRKTIFGISGDFPCEKRILLSFPFSIGAQSSHC
jgi:hypothetical protein